MCMQNYQYSVQLNSCFFPVGLCHIYQRWQLRLMHVIETSVSIYVICILCLNVSGRCYFYIVMLLADFFRCFPTISVKLMINN